MAVDQTANTTPGRTGPLHRAGGHGDVEPDRTARSDDDHDTVGHGSGADGGSAGEREQPPSGGERFFAALFDHKAIVLTVVAAITAALVWPLLALAPTESASTEPGGPVFDARDRIDESFVSSVHPVLLLVEDDGGDILRAEPLRSLLAAQRDLRSDPDIGPDLIRYFDPDLGVEVDGIVSLADLVDARLPNGLAGADDAAVKEVGSAIIDEIGPRSEALGVSAASTRDDDGQWIVPALAVPVLADNDSLGFGNTSIALGGDTAVEEWDRSVQEVLRRADGLSVWGVAIDVNLTSQEQGAVAGPFIGLTVLAVLVIVGLVFRSYWVVATVGAALMALMIWLKGISNLIGLEDDLVLSLIVPIAMISFGVDFAFHAIGRYREEMAVGGRPERAFVVGLAAVSGALLLALVSDTAAFLANVSAGIESIVQFGIGAGIALSAAYVLLGVVTPLTIAAIEARVGTPRSGLAPSVGRAVASLGAASGAMASVLLLVFVAPAVGVGLAALTILATLVVPYLVLRRSTSSASAEEVAGATATAAGSTQAGQGPVIARTLGGLVAGLAGARWLVLGIAVAVAGVAGSYAVRLDAAFDVEDFFSADTDFVTGLDRLDTHVGDRGGEPALVYVEADLASPAALAVLDGGIDEVQTLDTPSLARDETGVRIDGGIFSVFDAVWASPVAVGMVESVGGVTLTDADGDGIPDTADQVRAVVEVASANGVPFDAERLALTPDDVATAVRLDGDGVRGATVFALGLVDSRSQESVLAAREDLTPIVDELRSDLDGSYVELTGSAFVREASLEATSRALSVSLPIALLACLVVATVFLRSIRYGVVSIVPIAMVVAWLYGFMEVAGYSINIVTATIAAVSIGIGIDFALHFISRYREELGRHRDPLVAVRVAGEGTGTALAASALSSAVGFGIMAFAPMPLFAAYGLLTALMVLMALVATLVVLPGLLVIVSPRR